MKSTAKRTLGILGVLSIAVAICASAAAQIPTTAPPQTNVTPLGPQRHQAPGQQQPSRQAQIGRAPAPTSVQMAGQGTIVGYVYWDTKSVQHTPATNCVGLGSAVSVGTPPKGQPTFEQFKMLGTFHNFTYMGTVGTFAVCQYSVKQVPTDQDLQVQINFKQPAFAPAIVAAIPPTANDPNSPIKIPGGACNKLAPAAPSASVLGSSWWTCGDYAYNVNFILQPVTAANMMSGGGQITALSGSLQNGASNGQPSTNPGLLSGGSRSGMLGGGTAPAPTQSAVQSRPAIHSQLLPAKPGAAQYALTNADVVRMVKGGVPESVMITSIHSGSGKFDFSPAGCRTLAQAHVSRKVLDAMGNGGVRPCFTGGVHTAAGANRPVSLKSPTQGKKITNPKTAQNNAAIIAVLRKQSQAATAEAAQMKLSIRPVAIQTQPSRTMAASGQNGLLAPSSTVQPVAATGTTPSGTVAASSSTNRFGKLQPGMIPGVALQCGHDPTFRILTVSGGPHVAVFTQDSTNNYNFYTITGCSFGNNGPNVKAYIFYKGTFHQDFQIQQWSDNFIALDIDPSLTGVDDQNSLTLVIQRADGQQTSKSGYSFYAVRDTVLLKPIPQQYFGLNRFRPDQSVIQNWTPTYTSASSAAVTPNLAGLSAEVHWQLTTDASGNILGGSDLYDFSHLHSTFALDSASMEWVDLSCTDPNYNQFAASKSNWSINWYGAADVQVSWQGQVCQNTPGSCGGAFQGDCFANPPETNYGVDVWVTGPRGLDPWTGKPGS